MTPYVTAEVTQLRAPDGSLQTLKSLGRVFCTERHPECGYNGGVDVKFSLTPSLTLDATYRTDFAQVEVDQQQVNLLIQSLLSRKNAISSLKTRPPLISGGTSGSNANLVPFFSRRIGLSSAGTPVPITGGARITGQVDRYDVGFLTMKTEAIGTTPSNNYVVGRAKRNLLKTRGSGCC